MSSVRAKELEADKDTRRMMFRVGKAVEAEEGSGNDFGRAVLSVFRYRLILAEVCFKGAEQPWLYSPGLFEYRPMRY